MIMNSPPYSLEQILRVAYQHPFYNRDARYPPSRELAYRLVDGLGHVGPKGHDIENLPVITKAELYVRLH